MKQVYTSIILLITMLFGAMTIAQEGQKKYINYQGVARNADGNLMKDEPLTIGVKLNFGSSGSAFEETHELNTDANGVFSLLIGKGNVLSGEYDNLPWGEFATSATVSINDNEIGTTEMMAVPHALSSADNQWHTMGDDIENKNGGNVFVTGSLYASKDLSLADGAAINEFSTDITLGGNSDEIVPTQKAIKTYVDSQLGGTGGGADNQNAAEVAYDNSASGLTATTAQTAIDELVGSGAVDADSDPSNEIQTLSFDGTTNELSLTDGGSVILPSAAGAVDADVDPTNEIQDISLSGTELTISDGSTIDLAPIVPPGGTDDQNAGEVPYDNTTSGLTATDAQTAIDELVSGGLVDTDDQALVLTGDVLTIEDGVGSVDLSGYKDVDVTTKTGILLGDGSHISGLVGTADGQVAKWNAGTSTWEAGSDATGGGGGGSLWSENGGDIHFITGRVGIGIASPNAHLDISKESSFIPFLKLEATSGNTTDIRFGKEGVNPSWNQISEIGADAASSKMDLSFYDGGTLHSIMSLRGNFRMGINNPNPQSTLDVQGDIRSTLLTGVGERNVVADADGNLTIGSGGGGSSLWTENAGDIFFDGGKVGVGTNSPESSIAIETDGNQWNLSATEGDFRIGDATHRLKIGVATAGGGAGDARIRVEGGTDRMMLGGGTNDVLTITDQNVGVGTITPAEKLHVDGKIRSNDLSGGGNVVADADGNLVIGTGGGSSLWTENGGDIYYNTGDVGIGTNSSSAHLHIGEPAASGKPQLLLEESSSGFSRLRFKNSGKAALWDISAMGEDGVPGAANSKLNFYFENDQGTATRMTISGGGNVGIGTTTPTSKLDVKGDIKTSGEIHGPDTGNSNMMAIAYGTINDDGSIANGSGNFTVTTGSLLGYFVIKIEGESYSSASFTSSVTAYGAPGFVGHGNGGSGTLAIQTRNTSGVEAQQGFSFVTYKN